MLTGESRCATDTVRSAAEVIELDAAAFSVAFQQALEFVLAMQRPGKPAASVAAGTDCNLMSINRNDFLTLIHCNPAVGLALLKAQAIRLRNTNRR